MGHPEPDHFVDITNHLNTAVEALAAHVSQVDGRTADDLRIRMEQGRRRTGLGKGIQFAEAFKKIDFHR